MKNIQKQTIFYCLGGNLKLRGKFPPPKGPEKKHCPVQNQIIGSRLMHRNYLLASRQVSLLA